MSQSERIWVSRLGHRNSKFEIRNSELGYVLAIFFIRIPTATSTVAYFEKIEKIKLKYFKGQHTDFLTNQNELSQIIYFFASKQS